MDNHHYPSNKRNLLRGCDFTVEPASGEASWCETASDYRLGVAGRSIRQESPFGRRTRVDFQRRGGSALMQAAYGLVRVWPAEAALGVEEHPLR